MKQSILHVLKWTLILIVGGIIYLATAVPVGLFIYSTKSDLGINVFRKTGFHSYMQCLREEAYKTEIMNKQSNKTND